VQTFDPYHFWPGLTLSKLWDIVQGIQYCILTQNNWQNVWAKQKVGLGGGGILIFVEIVENQTPKLWEIVYSPNHTITHTLHKVLYSSIVEILENGI